MKKAILFLLAIAAASVFGAQKPPIIYSIYTTGTVAQVDAHVASAASIPAGVITNNQTGVVLKPGILDDDRAALTVTNGDSRYNQYLIVGGNAQSSPFAFAAYDNGVEVGGLQWGDGQIGSGFFGDGANLFNLNGANLQPGTVSSNALDTATKAQLALAGTGNGTRLTVGTNTFGILSNYIAGVYSQTTSLIIKGSTNTIANGVYAQVYSNFVDDVSTGLWTNGNGVCITYFNDGLDTITVITNSAGAKMFQDVPGGFLPGFPPGVNLYAVGNGIDGTMGWTSNTVAEPYWELQGWQADTNFYAGDIHAKVIYGDLSGASNYQFTAVGGVQTSNLLSTVNINETLRHSFAAPPMGFVGGELLNSTEATAIGRARYLYTNGLTAAGYNLVCLDAGWADRDANGIPILKTNLYPSGIASLINALATNDCKLGLYVSMFWPYGELKVYEATAYRDAYTLASWGIGWLKCDGGQSSDIIPEAKARHIGELLAAGLDAGAADKGYPPVFFHFNMPTNRLDSVKFANGYYATQPVKDATGNGDSVVTPAFKAFQSLYAFVTNAPNITGRGVWPSILNAGDGSGYAYWDTNCARVNMGLHCLEPWVLLIGDGQLAGTHASHIGIYTNREAIRINQDPAVGGAQWLSTNCVTITNSASQKARWRRMANGDIAVGLWNWNTNATSLFTLNLTKLPFIQTNVAYVLRVFDNVGQLVTNSLDTVVNTNGYNLLRISRNATIYDGAVLTNGASFAVVIPNTITSTNANVANTMLVLNGAQNGTAGNVLEYKTNNVSKFSVTTAGGLTLGSTISMGTGAISIGGQSTIGGVSGTTYLYSGGTSKMSIGSTLVTIYTALSVTNGLTISSNSWANVPSLAPGQNFYCSSNGVPHVIWSDEAGTLYTNRLVP